MVANPSYNLKVVASTVELDNLGRNVKVYKPFALSGAALPNKIISTYDAQTQTTYGALSSPYAETEYENWPEAKVLNTHLPVALSEAARITTFDDYNLPQIQFGDRTYLQNELIISIVKNEVGDETAVFTDKQGRKIAQYSPIGKSHTVGATGAINEDSGSPFEYAKTFYEYDDANNLKKITDPTGKIITYTYNSLGQVIQEINPDRGSSMYKYDNFGRLRFVRDQDDINQLNASIGGPFFIDHFTYNKYDDWNRLIESGMIKMSLISPVGTQPVFNDNYYINNSDYPNSTSIGRETHIAYEYDGNMLDNSLAQLTDDYVYSGHTNYTPQSTDHRTYTYDTRGQLATKTFNIDGLTVGHKYTYKYNVQGMPLTIAYVNPVNSAFNFTQFFTYDGMGNLIASESNSGSNYPLQDVSYIYDPLGRLFKKGLAPTGNVADPFQEYVAYNYDIRESQVKQIAKRFKNELSYDLKGNITNQLWNNNYFDNTNALPPYTLHSYDYYYDDLNRLTGADYSEQQSDNNPYATIEIELKDEIPLIICGPIIIDEMEERLINLIATAQSPEGKSELLLQASGKLLKIILAIKNDVASNGKTITDLTSLEVESYVRDFMKAINIEEAQLVEADILARSIAETTTKTTTDSTSEERTNTEIIDGVNNLTKDAESTLLKGQVDTTAIDSSIINDKIQLVVDTCNSILHCSLSNQQKVGTINERSRSIGEEIKLVEEALSELKLAAGWGCSINQDAMAYGTLINDIPVNPVTLTSQKYDAAYWYQANGNFTEVNRTNQAGGLTTQNYTYTPAKNQLAAVSWDETIVGISISNYNYDALGNLSSDLRSDVTNISYNQFHNLPVSMEKGTGEIYGYRYNAEGNRSVKVLNASDIEYYLDGIIVDQNDKPKQYGIADGFAILDAVNGLQKNYNITDWLGNVRLVMDATGNIQNARDHFPYGKLMDGRVFSGNTEGARYQFTGHEFDGETQFDYHGARYYNRELGRYMSMDPKQTDFASWSPYNYTLANPIIMIDIGGDSTIYYNSKGKLLHTSHDGLDNSIVVISNKNLVGFNKLLDFQKSNSDKLSGDHKGFNVLLRSKGDNYMIGDFESYDNANNKDLDENVGLKDVYREHGTYLYRNGNIITTGKENFRGDNYVIIYGSENQGGWGSKDGKGEKYSQLHLHPNAGYIGVDRTEYIYGPTPTDWDKTPAGGSKFRIAVDKTKIYFYKRDDAYNRIEFSINRKNTFQK